MAINSPETIRRILDECRTIAVVGLSSDPSRASNSVSGYMRRQGYRVIPVNPNETSVFGEKAYPDLFAVPEKIDLVDVFRRPDEAGKAVDEAIAVAPHVDAVLLDSGNQSLAVKELGGTGRTHDWSLSRKIRESIEAPLFLAGGLNPSNVAAAIREVQPFGIDVCSGLRTNGNLDREKLINFFKATDLHG